MERDIDDFFDTPRPNLAASGIKQPIDDDKNERLGDLSHAKPPVYPNKRTVAGNSTTGGGDTFPVADDAEDSYSSDSYQTDSDLSDDPDTGREVPVQSSEASKKSLRIALPDDSDECGSGRYSQKVTGSSSPEGSTDAHSEVTDVSPLNTPMAVPSQFSVLKSSTKSSKRQVEVRAGDETDRDTLDLDMILKTVLEIETSNSSAGHIKSSQKVQRQPVQKNCSSRRNYSFSNDQVRAIERENQRLMMRLMKHASGAKSVKKVAPKPIMSSTSIKRPSSAAINRAKELQKIESENMMILSRLQQMRPSRELQQTRLNSTGAQQTRSTSRMGVSLRSGSRPNSAPVNSRPKSSSHLGGGRRRPTDDDKDMLSRPGTAFPSRPDDDDVLTWEGKDDDDDDLY